MCVCVYSKAIDPVPNPTNPALYLIQNALLTPDTSRLARRGGVMRMKKEMYEEVRGIIKERLSAVFLSLLLRVRT